MFDQILKQTAHALNGARIPYMVIGGQAVLRYGEPRNTRDIDITLGIDVDRHDEIRRLTNGLGFEPVIKDVEVVRQTRLFVVAERSTGIRIDFIYSFTPYEKEAIRRAVDERIDNVDVRIASVEDVIIHKLFAGRPLDIEDVKGILRRTDSVDEKYLRHWLPQFSSVVGRDLVDEFSELNRITRK